MVRPARAEFPVFVREGKRLIEATDVEERFAGDGHIISGEICGRAVGMEEPALGEVACDLMCGGAEPFGQSIFFRPTEHVIRVRLKAIAKRGQPYGRRQAVMIGEGQVAARGDSGALIPRHGGAAVGNSEIADLQVCAVLFDDGIQWGLTAIIYNDDFPLLHWKRLPGKGA